MSNEKRQFIVPSPVDERDIQNIDQPPLEEIQLDSMTPYDINTPIHKGDTPIIATIKTSNKEDPDTFEVVDMRGADLDDHGGKVYGSFSFDPTVSFIIQGKDVDFSQGLGYKGVRTSEGELLFGRFDPDSMSGYDFRSRFSTSSHTSRNHFAVETTDQGIRVTDLGSLNGTRIAVSAGTIEPKVVENGYTEGKLETKKIGSTTDNMVQDTGGGDPGYSDHREYRELKSRADGFRQEILANPSQFDLTKKILEINPNMAPIKEVVVDDRRFLISPIRDELRPCLIAFSDIGDGLFAPRLFYKSNSEGGWRSSRYVYPGRNVLDKGEFELEGGYVQETKPVGGIAQVIGLMDKNPLEHVDAQEGVSLYQFFQLSDINGLPFDTYNSEVSSRRFDSIPEIYKQSPGLDFLIEGNDGPAREYFANLDLPEDFTPNFAGGPSRSFVRDHTLLGDVKSDCYEVSYDGSRFEWQIASDAEGRVWIDRILDMESRANSYGVYDVVVLAGLLSNKPIEYRSQVYGLGSGLDFTDFSETYVDITPLLDNLKIIKDYRDVRNIHRRK